MPTADLVGLSGCYSANATMREITRRPLVRRCRRHLAVQELPNHKVLCWVDVHQWQKEAHKLLREIKKNRFLNSHLFKNDISKL